MHNIDEKPQHFLVDNFYYYLTKKLYASFTKNGNLFL